MQRGLPFLCEGPNTKTLWLSFPAYECTALDIYTSSTSNSVLLDRIVRLQHLPCHKQAIQESATHSIINCIRHRRHPQPTTIHPQGMDARMTLEAQTHFRHMCSSVFIFEGFRVLSFIRMFFGPSSRDCPSISREKNVEKLDFQPFSGDLEPLSTTFNKMFLPCGAFQHSQMS